MLLSKANPWKHNVRLMLNVSVDDVLMNIYYMQRTLLCDLGWGGQVKQISTRQVLL